MLEQERSFLNLAIQFGFLGQTEARECIAIQQQLSLKGQNISIWDVALKKGFLTAHQIQRIRLAMQQSRSTSFFPGYRILKKLGQGGMGSVYAAIQTNLDRKVAIKVFSPDQVRDRIYLERIGREAKTLAKLNHPNVVSAIDFGCHNGVYYLVMEYVEGTSLDKELKKGVIFPEKEALSIVLQIAKALEHAHQFRLIHRDIKPANIMIDSKGVAKLCDLGLAKETGLDSKDSTQTSSTVGTPVYMSPEQVRGEKDIDIRTDIYSLGATLYHLVTGQKPYKGQGVGAIFAQILSNAAPNPKQDNPNLSYEVHRLIKKMMAKDRKKRIQTPEELIKAINEVQKGANYSTVSKIHLSKIQPHGMPQRNKLLITGIIVLSSFLLGLLTVSFLSKSRVPPKKQGRTVKANPSSLTGQKDSNINGKNSSGMGTGISTTGGAGSSNGNNGKTSGHETSVNPEKKPPTSSSWEKQARNLLGAHLQNIFPGKVLEIMFPFRKGKLGKTFLFWDKSLSSWDKKPNAFLPEESLRFILPYDELLLLSILVSKPGDCGFHFYFENGKNYTLFLNALSKRVELWSEGTLLKKSRVSYNIDQPFPFAIRFLKKNLVIGSPTLVYFKYPVPGSCKYFEFSAKTYLEIEGAMVGVKISPETLEQGIQTIQSWNKFLSLKSQAISLQKDFESTKTLDLLNKGEKDGNPPSLFSFPPFKG
ncbi:MAG: serine/threonine protein kinase, partial [Planctomycetota bacterium]